MFGVSMFAAFFYGFGTGIVLSSMLGTVFFSLIQTSLDHGVRTTMFISIGVIISDIILILLTYFNAGLLPENSTTEMVVRIVGACILAVMGVSNLYRKTKMIFPVMAANNKWLLAAKGFSLNFFNPGNFISWLAVSALMASVLHYTYSERLAYYVGALTAIFLAEVGIAYGAWFLRRFISDRFLHVLNMVLGVVFCAFAVVLLWPLAKKLLMG